MLGGAIFLASLAFYIAWIAGYFQLDKSHTSPVIITWADTAKIFGLFFLFQFLLFPIIAYGALAIYTQSFIVSLQGLSTEVHGWLNLLAILFMAIALAAFCCYNWKVLKPLFFRGHLFNDIALGMSSWLIAYPQVVLLSLLLTFFLSDLLGFNLVDQLAVRQMRNVFEYPLLFNATAFTVVLIVPLMEELLFRGFLQTSLRRQFRPLHAILLTSLIFALFHFSLSQGMNNITILGSLFLLSLFLGFLRERQGTLWPSWALHATFNALSIGMILNDIQPVNV